jgi:hypothetical protein
LATTFSSRESKLTMSAHPNQTVAVLGATDNPERYSFKAVQLLKHCGHQVIPVNPFLKEVDGQPVTPTLRDIKEPVDTLTLYVGPARLEPLTDDIVRLKPGRVIFNPGTESNALQLALTSAGIPWQESCTLVLLRTREF